MRHKEEPSPERAASFPDNASLPCQDKWRGVPPRAPQGARSGPVRCNRGPGPPPAGGQPPRGGTLEPATR
eukprot:9871913-Lingulodinium_polyedra.AAC.1